MHELPIMEDVLNIVVDFGLRNNANKIVKINLRASALSGIIPKWATIFFKMISRDTIAQDAILEFAISPIRVNCRDCFQESDIQTNPPVFVCSACGSDEVSILSGRDLRIESIGIL
ncbi:Zn finger protein HypA/HybF (possibly regulating hydrogenase expression) [Desulfitobacterium dichloroeliminans LMG P-21439]|uniref:Hydrogenase maturation factor HypA n=1 Tax=Desulfitobacterium dichloroeliminans (strain LMG P-21439 / DCA1) TaxID=871963 RepID=L0F5E0_DESDL|nr:hydrogenase maturation nickel metallochaperone HypA [Desulfitobacterium dichloroeliminans]AGA68260.1 Zn finger protein HypA/HybF (possibly regulating hydrogenase expression) [Desulfitobacterium dichloroeliminans LMG P-21439]